MIASSLLKDAARAALDGQITAGVFETVPATEPRRYVVLGETTELPWDTHDSDGAEATLTVHTWVDDESRDAAVAVMNEVDARLHHQPLPLAQGKLVMLRREFVTLFPEPRTTLGETWWHGVTRYRALISE